MKNLKHRISIALLIFFFSSCKKEETASETWQFTKMVNITKDNSGALLSIDFYQKKGNQWRIVQMEPDDYTKFYLKKIVTPNAYQLPIENENAFMTPNVRLFTPDNKVYDRGNIKWLLGEPIYFKTFNTFSYEFPDMPSQYADVSKFSAATYSYEQVYDNNGKNDSYIFYDFSNQKYLYYGFRAGADLILENALTILCPTCNSIDWKNIDAATCTVNYSTAEDLYYFFDFDAKKFYIITRINKNSNNPSFTFDTGLVINFNEAFFNEAGSNVGNELPFDFSK
ncbi:MAG: hypothetical protein IT275_04575 [Chitinophagales bacterium]|nr:hypothetical protein [Chitinophagales bacterium]